MSFLRHPTIRKWIAHAGEFASFLVFSGFSVLRGDLIKTDWTHAFEKNYQPKYLLGWALAGLSLGALQSLSWPLCEGRSEGRSISSRFHRKYRKMLSAAIESLSVPAGADRGSLEAFENSLLEAIADTVSYYRKATSLVNATVTSEFNGARHARGGAQAKLVARRGGLPISPQSSHHNKTSRQELDIPADLALPVYRLDSPMKGRNNLWSTRSLCYGGKTMLSIFYALALRVLGPLFMVGSQKSVLLIFGAIKRR